MHRLKRKWLDHSNNNLMPPRAPSEHSDTLSPSAAPRAAPQRKGSSPLSIRPPWSTVTRGRPASSSSSPATVRKAKPATSGATNSVSVSRSRTSSNNSHPSSISATNGGGSGTGSSRRAAGVPTTKVDAPPASTVASVPPFPASAPGSATRPSSTHRISRKPSRLAVELGNNSLPTRYAHVPSPVESSDHVTFGHAANGRSRSHSPKSGKSVNGLSTDYRRSPEIDGDRQLSWSQSHANDGDDPRMCGGHAAVNDQNMRANRRRLTIATSICVVFFVVELIGGLISGSLALLSDAFHLLSDITGFAISLLALYLVNRPATHKHSFGYHRVEILGAILSIFIIWICTAFLCWEALDRLYHPRTIDANVMALTAGAGVVVNIVMAFVLGHEHHHHGHGHSHEHAHDDEHNHEHVHTHNYRARSPGRRHNNDSHSSHIQIDNDQYIDSSDEHDALLPQQRSRTHSRSRSRSRSRRRTANKRRYNINVHSAYIHVLGDLLFSVGVFISSLIIWFDPSKHIVDPICTFFFSVIVLVTTFKLLVSSVTVLMEATPPGVHIPNLLKDLEKVKGVVHVHDLHVWSLTINKPALACHVMVESPEDAAGVLAQCQKIVCEKWGIHHSTIQIEIAGTQGFDIDNSHCRSFICNIKGADAEDYSDGTDSPTSPRTSRPASSGHERKQKPSSSGPRAEDDDEVEP